MMKFRGRPGLGLALGLVLALAAQTSNAGSLQIDLTITGLPTISIFAGSGFEVPNINPALDETVLTVDTAVLNDFLALNGFANITFSSYGASSNIPGAATSSFVTQNGTVNLAAGSGAVTFTSLAYGTGFLIPPTPAGNGTLHSSSQVGLTNTAVGDGLTFQSWYNPNNDDSTLPPSVPSPSLAFVSPNLANSTSADADTAALTAVGPVTSPYSLINQADVTITAVAGQSPTISFGGQTVLTVQPIPEPASVVMTMSALPIVFGLIRRYRRAVKSVG